MTLAAAEFESLALAQSDLLYRLARRLTRSPATAEDLVQETYLRAFKARETFKLEKYGIRPWLVRILHNVHFSRSDREKRQPRATDETTLDATAGDSGSPIGVPIDLSSFDAMDERVVHALEELPEEYKTVLLLWAVEEFSYKEISESLDIPMGTVMSRLHRARQRLSEQLKDFAKEARITQE